MGTNSAKPWIATGPGARSGDARHHRHVPRTTEALGPARLLAALRQAGVEAVVPGDAPGLAVALGRVGVSLEGLVQSYATIARGGEARGVS